MELFLHSDEGKSDLADYYRRAFDAATELFIVTAYLTEWNYKLKLGKDCRTLRIIVGKDFGITRKKACHDVLRWLPGGKKSNFLVADSIQGFHPKAVFWKEMDGSCHAIIGSSNLTNAAFERNFEANAYSEITGSEYERARKWLEEIEGRSVPVSEDWLGKYIEAIPASNQIRAAQKNGAEGALFTLELPRPRGMRRQIERRRAQLRAHEKLRTKLVGLFKDCADGKISSRKFYERLPSAWGGKNENRFQGAGWERHGKSDSFVELSKSLLRILEAPERERDDVVSAEIDRLADKKVSSRKSFFSEMLCLEFPKEYPILNKPMWTYLDSIEFRWARGSSEGSRYIDLARKLRVSLRKNPNHPAKNLAELDTVIWKKYGDNH